MSDEEIREAARLLGSKRTEKKIEAGRRVSVLGAEARRAQRRKLSEIECTCGAGDSLKHGRKCKRYFAIRYRQQKGLPME